VEGSQHLAVERSDALPRNAILAFLHRYRVVFIAFCASRLALLTVGLMTQVFIEPFSTHVSPLRLTDSAALRPWGQWDSGWYMRLASHGYATHPEPDGQVNWVFFPFYPMLSAGIAKVTHLPIFTAMLGLSNLSFLGALILAHRFAREMFDARTADVTVALLCTVPGSYIFSSAYTESLFLLALTACLVLLHAKKWLAAGACAAVAVLTRNLGLGLILSFAVAVIPGLWTLGRDVLERQPSSGHRLVREIVRVGGGLALPVLALAGFCLFLYHRTGDPLAFVTAQKAWGRTFEFPLLRPLAPIIAGELPDGDVVSFAAAWLSMVLVAALAFMRRWSLLVLAQFLTLVPMASGLTSYARYCLVVLPLFLAAGRLLAPRPTATLATLIVFATLNGFLMVAWTLCMWITA
jgi:hypothetical protein